MNAITAFLSKAAVVLIGLATVALPVPAFAQAPLVADYQFNETLASSIEGAPSLSALGKWNPFITETVDGQPITVFSFGAAGDPGTGLLKCCSKFECVSIRTCKTMDSAC